MTLFEKIHDVSEMYVVKQGFLRLRGNMKWEDELFEFPTRKNGSSMVLRRGWFLRVLKGDASLSSCPLADVAAAQSDIKHLSIWQCLWIRCENLNSCETECAQFQAHKNFLELIDRRICLCIGTRVLQDLDLEVPKKTNQPGQGMCMEQRGVMALGLKIALLSGAYTILSERRKNKIENDPVPQAFAFEVDHFDSTEPNIAFYFPDEFKACSGPEGEKIVMVVRDNSRDLSPRRITWDVYAIILEEDYMTQIKREIEMASKSGETKKVRRATLQNDLHNKNELLNELQIVLLRRRSTAQAPIRSTSQKMLRVNQLCCVDLVVNSPTLNKRISKNDTK